jgi:hypothetical protein
MKTVELPTAKYDTINVPAFMNWILELESGRTQQGESRLHTVRNGQDHMCCLGVVTRQLVDPLGVEVAVSQTSDEVSLVLYNDKGGFAPDGVLQHLGIPKTHLEDRGTGWTVLVHIDEEAAERLNTAYSLPRYYAGGETVSVHMLNDNGFSFGEIAAFLRKEFLNA